MMDSPEQQQASQPIQIGKPSHHQPDSLDSPALTPGSTGSSASSRRSSNDSCSISPYRQRTPDQYLRHVNLTSNLQYLSEIGFESGFAWNEEILLSSSDVYRIGYLGISPSRLREARSKKEVMVDEIRLEGHGEGV